MQGTPKVLGISKTRFAGPASGVRRGRLPDTPLPHTPIRVRSKQTRCYTHRLFIYELFPRTLQALWPVARLSLSEQQMPEKLSDDDNLGPY